MNIVEATVRFINITNNRISQILASKHWLIKVTLFALLLSLFFASPDVTSDPSDILTKRATAVAAQIEDLQHFWETSEPTNAMFRITVPLIASVLGIGLKGTLILQFLTGILIFLLVGSLVERETGNRLIAFYATLLVALIYPGTAAFLESRYYFDSFAYLFLLAALWFRSPVSIGLMVLLAGFTDERALIASGFVFLWWTIKEGGDYYRFKSFFNKRSLAVVVALFVYIGIRLFLQRHYGIETWSEARSEFLLFDQINNSVSGMWSGLEAGWLLIALAIIAMTIKKRWLVLTVFVTVIAVQIVAALAVVDITRSMGYLLPSILVAILILFKEQEVNLKNYVMVACFVSLIALNYGVGGKSSIWLFYPLPIQLLRFVMGR